MEKAIHRYKDNIGAAIIILMLNLTMLIAWHVNPYNHQLVGAIFEILWLFWIVSLFTNPIIAFIFWKKEKYALYSLFFYLLIWTVLTIVYFLVFYQKM